MYRFSTVLPCTFTWVRVLWNTSYTLISTNIMAIKLNLVSCSIRTPAYVYQYRYTSVD
eukprot:SAG11_NODE_260_length_11531_cov_6.271781_12_plen_58_part_00